MANTGKTNKSTKAQIDLVLEMVIEMLVKGQSRTDILRYFTENEDTTKRRSVSSVEKYIKHATKKIKERFQPDKDKMKAMAIARYSDLYKRNYTIQDYRECRQIQDSVNKLMGLNEPEKKELTGENGSAISFDLTLRLD